MPLLDDNTGGNALLSPTGIQPQSYNFIDPYVHAIQYSPNKLETLYLRNGKGKITKFTEFMGNMTTYASDKLQHSEMGRLQQVSENVTVSGDTFTCTEAHNLRPKEIIMISDGTIEGHAQVASVTSDTVFVANNMEDGAFAFTGKVSLFAYSNAWGKGEGTFEKGKAWGYENFYNYTQIMKEFYTENKSDIASIQWLKAPQYEGGYGWFSTELGRTLDLNDNHIELTQIFGRRSTAGSADALAGGASKMKGLIQQVEERGNLGNQYITTKEELYDYALRLKKQGDCRTATIWADHQQMIYFNEIAAALNAGYAGGSDYGMFKNGKDMAVSLDFKTIYVTGVTFHITPLAILDQPDLLGAANFSATSLAAILIPSGDKTVMENGNKTAKPYFSTAYRSKGNITRLREVEFFGRPFGTPIEEDRVKVLCLSEQSNQLIAANNFFVVRKNNQYA